MYDDDEVKHQAKLDTIDWLPTPRIDIVGQNGNDGEHYIQKGEQMSEDTVGGVPVPTDKPVDSTETEYTLPTEYQAFYVYQHTEDGEVVYVGIGTSCRAFRATGSGNRSEEHSEWLKAQYELGQIPVSFYKVGMTKEDALKLETELIEKHRPKFNKMKNPDYEVPKKQSQETANFAKGMYSSLKAGYRNIAYLMGADNPKSKVMSIKRMIQRGK